MIGLHSSQLQRNSKEQFRGKVLLIVNISFNISNLVTHLKFCFSFPSLSNRKGRLTGSQDSHDFTTTKSSRGMRQRGVFHKVSGQGPETLSYNEKAGLLAGLGPMVYFMVILRRSDWF